MAAQASRRSRSGDLKLDPRIEVAAARLSEVTNAHAVLLFGSRARGDHDQYSDWDLCVILPDDVEWGRFTAARLRPLISDLGLPIQIVPIRRVVYEAKKNGINNLSYDIACDGVVICGTLDSVSVP